VTWILRHVQTGKGNGCPVEAGDRRVRSPCSLSAPAADNQLAVQLLVELLLLALRSRDFFRLRDVIAPRLEMTDRSTPWPMRSQRDRCVPCNGRLDYGGPLKLPSRWRMRIERGQLPPSAPRLALKSKLFCRQRRSALLPDGLSEHLAALALVSRSARAGPARSRPQTPT
jgi:hypothetical protein